MIAQDTLAAADLTGTLAALQDSVRKSPADARLRIFLFQLLCVTGDFKRAIAQLKLCAELDSSAEPMARTYREAIACELYREKVFDGEKDPLIFGEPQEWVALLLQALKTLAAGKPAEAAELRARAFELAPAEAGQINDTPFDWVADADSRIGPVLEAVIDGKYYWLPFNLLRAVTLDPPADLRDAVWMPATLTFRNGGDTVALLPTRYAGTATKGNDAQKLSRATDWADLGSETFAGLGQRLLATEAGDVALMDLRSMTFGEGSADG
ncbi:type VI secretion system accessory protein TagJ [Pseudooceanicola sp. C21-150M6]|uniref:type VI secretion system accessory protein TagJ n=1 Tax=Pseudooceanicola sp. C21-150M6 TaxID=3434355 RepID=UPI003D7F4087